MVRRFRVGKSWGEYVLIQMQRKVEDGGKYVRYDRGIHKLSGTEMLGEFVRDAQAKGRKGHSLRREPFAVR